MPSKIYHILLLPLHLILLLLRWCRVLPKIVDVDVDVDATLAAAGTGDEHTAGEVISSRHHPGGHADENSMPDVVSLSQLQGVLRKQQMEFQQEMQQQNEEFQQQFAAALGGISAGNE